MKVLKSKNLTNLILAFLLALPICAIAGRVIYTQSNKNAYQSYSEISSETHVLVSANNTLIQGNTYMINLLDEGSGYSDNIYFDSCTIDFNYIAGTEISYDVAGIRFYPNNTHFRLITPTNVGYSYELNDAKREYLNGQTFTWSRGNLIEPNQAVRFYAITYTSGKLDNAFEYSLKSFVADNDFGQMDLTSWFSGLFLRSSAHNNLYIGFINWYLNYAMLVTLVHFLFLVLMWFINYCRRLIDRSMNYDW